METGKLKRPKSVVKKTKEWCLFCGRTNKGVAPRVHAIEVYDQITQITAPWCLGSIIEDYPPLVSGKRLRPRCPQLTEEEKALPEIRKRQLKKPALGDIDSGVRELVKACWDRGLDTFLSCDGHGGPGFVTFWDRDTRDAAMIAIPLFKKVGVKRDRTSPLFGTLYDVVLPSGAVEWSPRRQSYSEP